MLKVEVYGTTTTLITDPQHELSDVGGIGFSTCYPAGMFGAGRFFLPHNIARNTEVQGVRRVVFRHGPKLVYEGWISNIASEYGAGFAIDTVGAWGLVAMNRSMRKIWADTRIDNNTWTLQTAGLETENWTIERQDRIHITPNPGGFSSGEYIALRYTMPIGETIKRITYDYDFAEKAGQSWEMSVWRSTDGVTFTEMSASGTSGDEYTSGTTTVIVAAATGSIDVALATPSRYMELRFYARGSNTVTNNDHNHGLWSALTVYSELGNINMYEIAKDIVGAITVINSGTQYIQAAGTPLSLIPYIVDDWRTIADILDEITDKGDGTYARWAAYFLDSEQANTIQSAPLLALAPYVTTADYEYKISMSEAPGLVISEDFDQIINDMVVSYSDDAGKTFYRTSADNAALANAASQGLYKKRTPSSPFSLGLSTSTIADAYAQRLLAYYKDPLYRWSGPLTVEGYIRGKGDNPIHASEIRAGNRIRIDDYQGGRTWVITQTDYTDDGETCTISVGEPELPLMMRSDWGMYGPDSGRRGGRLPEKQLPKKDPNNKKKK
jgi:hypothetical protein